MKAAIRPQVWVGEMVGFMIRLQSFENLGDQPRTRVQLFCEMMREFVIDDIPDRNEIKAPLYVNIHMNARRDLTRRYLQVCAPPKVDIDGNVVSPMEYQGNLRPRQCAGDASVSSVR